MNRFENKVVLITGAADGLGKKLASNFIKEGAKVALVDIIEEKLMATKNEFGLSADRCIAVVANVAKEADIKNYVEKTLEAFGKIDVFCNNAGICKNKLIKETDEATLDLILGVNLKGFYLGMKHVIRAMEANRSGVIVNTGSVDCYSAAKKNALYTSTKYSVLAMTRCAALEEAEYGIRVNVVCPGPINTELMRDYERRNNPDDPQAIIYSFSSQIPLGRYAETQDVSNAVMFLASDDASYITGTKLVVDGGWTTE